MISATQLRRVPPPWPTLVSLWASGWFAGLFVVRLSPPRLVDGGLATALIYLSAAGALLGALVLRVILPRVAGVTISYLWAVVAIGLGSLAANAFAFAVQTAAYRSVPRGVPSLWTSPFAVAGATVLSLLVSYQVVAATCRAPHGRIPAFRQPAVAAGGLGSAPAGYPPGLAGDAARAQDAVAHACVELSHGAAVDVPALVVDALTELGIATEALRQAAPDDPQVGMAVERFVAGLERFQTALTGVATAAARTGTQHLYQRGPFGASMADVSDGGALARYELDHADGLAEIRASCERLRALGVLPE